MKTHLRFLCLCLAMLATGVASRAQLTGTVTVPSTTYPDLASVITALNTQGVGTGGCTVNIATGNAQTAPTGGYQLGSAVLNASLSGTQALIINGNNNTVTGQTGTGSTDGIFWLMGTDYVTINALNLTDASTTTTATSTAADEWGYVLAKRNTTAPYDGCQHVTINNCTISLNKYVGSSVSISNTSTNIIPFTANSTGILAAHLTPTSTSLSTTGYVASDANSYNVFTGNTITNVTRGIYLGNGTTPGSVGVYDKANQVGGLTSASGNTITIGGTSLSNTPLGVVSQYDSVITVQNNKIYIGAGQTGSGTICEHFDGVGVGDVNVLNNYFNIACSVTTASVYGYLNSYYQHTDAGANFNFTGNEVTGNITTATTGYIGAMYNYYNSHNILNVSSNNIHDIDMGVATSSSAYFYGLYSYYNTVASTINANSNRLYNLKRLGTTPVLYFYATYFYDYPGSLTRFNFNNNSIRKLTTCANYTYVTYNYGPTTTTPARMTVNNNRIDSIDATGNTTSYDYIYNYLGYYSGDSSQYKYDTISNIFGAINGFSNTSNYSYIYNQFGYCYYGQNGSVSKGNYLNNITGNYCYIYNYVHYYHQFSDSNTFSNMSVGVGLNGVSNNGGITNFLGYYGTNYTASNHLVYNMLAGGSAQTIYNYTGYYGTNATVYNNVIRKITTLSSNSIYNYFLYYPTGGGKAYGNWVDSMRPTNGTCYSWYSYPQGNDTIYNNRITNITTAGTTNTLYGYYLAFPTTGFAHNFYNNFLGNIEVPSTYVGAAIYGIYTNGTGDYKLYNNTIRISPSATITGGNFGGTGIYYSNASGTLDLRNNIINVNITPTGTGTVAALRRASGTLGTSPTNFLGSSNSNIYYTPNVLNSWLYAEGTSTAAVNTYNLTNDPAFNTPCGLFKSFVGHDQGSFTENNLTLSSVGSGTYVPSGSSYAESGGTATQAPFVSTDYLGVTRSNPSDIGALQFSGTAVDNAPPQISYTPVPVSSYCSTAPIITATITDQTGVDTTSGKRPRLYYKKSTETNAFGGGNTSATSGWKYVEAAPGISGNTYTFVMDYSLLTSTVTTGTTIQYFVIAQDVTASTNTGASIASFPTCATSVALTAANGPTNTSPAINAFTILTTPTFAVQAGTLNICVSGSTYVQVNPVPLGTTIQWESATATGPFSPISGATAVRYNTPILTSTTRYRATLYCGASVLTTLSPVTISVNNPVITSTTAAAQCGYGSPTISAATNPGTSVNWYTSAGGNNPVYTGTSYTVTPAISSSTTYYAAAVVPKGQTEVMTKTLPASYYSYFTWTNYGNDIHFSDTTDFYTTTVYAMGSGTGVVYVELYDSASGYTNLVKTAGPFSVTGAGTTFNGKYVLNLAWQNIPPGGYRMVLGSASTAQLHYEYVSPTPYNIYSNLTGRSWMKDGYYGAVYNYYYFGFYDNVISGPCENPTRYPVPVTVTPAPPIAASSPNTPGICSGSSATITVSSANGTYVYTWQPGALSGATQTVTPSGTTTYVVNATDVLSGCKAIDSVKINVNPQQPAPTLSPVSQTICEKSVIQITATPGTSFGGTGTVGTGTTQNSVYGYPSAFGGYYQGHHEQYLIRGSELTAAGIQSGALNSIAFDITAAVPSSSLPLRNFIIRIAPTSLTALTGGSLISTGFTTVFSAATFTPAGSTGWQTIPFGTQFQWNGSTNIIVDIAEYNCTSCPTSACSWSSYPGNSTQNSTNTSFVSNVYFYGTTDCSITSFNPTGSSTYNSFTSTRPNMRFTWAKPYNINWTNVTGLYKSYPPLANPMTATDTNTVAYASPVTTQVYRAYTNAVGCISPLSAPDTLFVNPAPNVIVTPANNQTICAGQTVTISVPTGGTNIYQWYVNGVKITTGGTSNSLIVSTAGTYRVAVTNLATGCADTSIPKSVIVNPLPTNTVTAGGVTTFCNGGSVVLTSTSTSSPVIYQWYQNGVAISASAGGNLPTYTATTSGTYYSVVTNVNQCTQQSNIVTVTVNTVPNTIASLGSTTFCTGGKDTLAAPTTGTGAPYTYVWYYNGTAAPAPNTNSYYVATAAGTYYAIISSASTGCSVTSTNTVITVGSAPSSAITPAGAQGLCSGDSLTLTTNTSSGLTITWYKNGVSTGQTTSSIVVKTAGSYTANVAITAQPTCNSTSSTATVVTINPLPVVSITAGSAPTTFCQGGSVQLTASGTGVTSWQWYNNGVAVPGANTASYTAITAGSYTVVGTNSNGCKGTSNAIAVTVNPLPVIAATPSGPTTFCNGGSVVLTATPATYTNYVWKNGATTVSSGTTATSYTASQNGQYSVTVTNSNNCSNTSATVNVQVNPTPDSSTTPTGTVNICQGGTTTLCGAATNPAYTYQWRNGASNIGGATNKCYTTGTGGTYTLRVTNSITSCFSISQPVNVIINTPPTALATRVGPATICAGDSSKLTASTGPSYTYQWYYNSTPIAAGGTDSVFYAKLQGSYNVKVTNIGGCSTTSNSVTVNVNPAPAAYITYNTPVTFCEGSAVVLTANSGTSLTYQWLINDTLTNNTSGSFIAMTTGIYTVKTTNNFGCSTKSDTLHVRANTKPTPVIDRINDTVYATQAYANYQWFFNNNAIGGATLPFYKYAQNGAYKLRVIDSNGCEGYSDLLFIQNVGVTPSAISAAIKVFPNPTTGLLRIESPVKVKLVLRDVTGKAVVEAVAVKELDITPVANGIYLLYISDMEGKLLRADKVTKTGN